MGLTPVDKIKINKFMKDNAIGEIYYQDMVDALGKKCNVSDLEFLEHFTECVIKEFSKDGKISAKQVSKYISTISSFITWLHEADTSLDLMLIDKIKSFRDLYEEYLKRNNIEKESDLIDTYIDELNATLNELYPTEETNESVFRYLAMIQALEAELKRVEKELNDLNKLYEVNQKNLNQKQERVDDLNKETNILHGEVSRRDKIISDLKEEVSSLEKRISELELSLTDALATNHELEPFRSKCDDLADTIERLNGIIEEYKKEKEAQEEAKKQEAITEKREANIESLIFQKLIETDATSQELLGYVRANGASCTPEQVKALLKRMKTKLNITEPSFGTDPKHRLTPTYTRTNGFFKIDLEPDTKHYDMVLISDCHLENMDKKTIEVFDSVNDYCAKQGIHLILNLGDLFNGDVHNYVFAQAEKDYRLVEETIQNLPKADGIYHAILGGNHDRKIGRYGFDPIEMLADEREDIINLGYTHSTIELMNQEDKIGEFDIHHPDSFEFPIDLEEDGIDTTSVFNYLNKVYGHQHRSRNSSYIDIFGHTHKAQFNIGGSYCYIPSLFEGRSKRGACHLRIYFDNLQSIKYMVLMPLSFNTCNHLVKNNEIIHQKMLTR